VVGSIKSFGAPNGPRCPLPRRNDVASEGSAVRAGHPKAGAAVPLGSPTQPSPCRRSSFPNKGLLMASRTFLSRSGLRVFQPAGLNGRLIRKATSVIRMPAKLRAVSAFASVASPTFRIVNYELVSSINTSEWGVRVNVSNSSIKSQPSTPRWAWQTQQRCNVVIGFSTSAVSPHGPVRRPGTQDVRRHWT